MRYFIVGAMVLLLAGNVYAHRVNVYAYAEAGRVYVEGYFVDGSKAKNSTVEVLRADTGERLLTGRTDSEGRFSFKVPGPYPLRIILRAGMGHENEYVLSKEEVLEALGMEVPEKEPEEVAGSEVPSEDLDAVLQRHLGPIREELRRLARAQERPSLRDVIGGLGYIMGLVGVYLYGKAHRKSGVRSQEEEKGGNR